MPISRSIRSAALGLLAVAALVAGLAGVSTAQTPPPEPAKVAVVNYHRILFEYRRQTQLREEMDAFTAQLQKELTDAQTGIRNLETELQSLSPRSPRRSDLEEQIIQKRAELAVQERLARLRQQEKMVEVRTDLYNDIAAQVSIVAREAGYTLVLRVVKDDPAGDLGFGVMHFDEAIDITDRVIRRLNAAYPTP